MAIQKNIIFYSSIIFILILISFFPAIISGYSPFEIDFQGLTPPGGKHLLGTDFLGRDILSRTIISARISILIGVLARLGSIFIGTLVGFAMGNSRGWLKVILTRVVEIFLALPALLLAMALAVVLGKGSMVILVAIIVGTWAPVARLVAIRVEDIRTYDYVRSAYALGGREFYIQKNHVFPSLLPTLVPVLTTGIATSIMMESTLSFLGLGGGASAMTIPGWGLMINEGMKFLFEAPWIIFPPVIGLMILILCFNRLGDIISSK